MKTRFLFLVSFLFCNAALFGQSIFDKYEDNENITTVVISQKMFQMLSKIDSNDPDTKEFMEIANKLKALKIFSTETASVSQQMKKEVESYVKGGSLSEFMRVKEKNTNVKFYVKEGKTKDIVSELVMFVQEDKETVLMILTGEVDLNKIGVLSKNINILPKEMNQI
ncbi:conserved exported hypothetical protein [Capnocytophaga canis]|uniref:DUF4252 domain-containing protein n=1 Tax=Capnocytophaga canis TaxID=1848903 RepID=A0A3A1YJF8_9FLAO|nr:MULTISPECIES: DUF4252 domain-containing protein [Capnocytophaga]ATA72151.1 DUF4252 domain-containing protein [Capnocytophaga sp. H4358]ATA74270.1 DUF4252 domain-containing protein [Capnocytophaga sp. H2931]RIY37576.1 DUF4252 domain-containing protein [Capnocytophaga canis]CEN42487.1 conserved exported hypothetical protein [Capnocytophaga canis]GIM61803.1 hypothetical protein CAPN008_18530 [Capnocytophaga canis]